MKNDNLSPEVHVLFIDHMDILSLSGLEHANYKKTLYPHLDEINLVHHREDE